MLEFPLFDVQVAIHPSKRLSDNFVIRFTSVTFGFEFFSPDDPNDRFQPMGMHVGNVKLQKQDNFHPWTVVQPVQSFSPCPYTDESLYTIYTTLKHQ